MTFGGSLFNNLFSLNNSLSYFNRERWSTFAAASNNNKQYSGMELSLSSSFSFSQTGVLFAKTPFEMKFPISLGHTLGYQVLRTTFATKPRELSQNSSLSLGFNMLDANLNWTAALSHSILNRQTNGMHDAYIDNVIDRRMGFSTSLKLYWLSASTSFNLDLLELTNKALTWEYSDITNRMRGGFPRLSMSFSPPAPFPSISYVYDIIKNTNISFDINSSYSFKNLQFPLLDNIELISMNASYHHDFLNPRSTAFNMSFSTIINFAQYWRLSFSTQVKNNKIFRYFRENQDIFVSGEYYVDFWKNLWDSVNVFDYEGLKRGLFKIQGLNFELSHDLDEWRMSLIFNIRRIVRSDLMLSYWEPEIRIEFVLVGSGDQFPPYSHKFVPDELQ